MANKLEVKITGDASSLKVATEQARASIKRTSESVESLANTIKAMPGFGGFAASLGALVSAGTIKALIGDTISWAASLDDLSEKTGASVENLSGLSKVAKISGVDMGLIEGSLIRLAKALSGADEESKGAGHALAFLNLNAEQLRDMDSAQALEQIANAMAQYGDGTGKTALALAIFGREGAQLLPLLKDLAEEHLRAGKLTTEQAAAAELLEKAWRRTNAEGGQWAKQIALDLMPTLASLLDFVTATKEGIFQVGSSLAVVANDIIVFAQVAAAAISGGLTSEGQAHIKQLLAERARFVEAANEDMVKRLSSIESLRAKIDAALAGNANNKPKAAYKSRDPKEPTAGKSGGKDFRGIQNEDDMIYAIQEAVRLKNRKAFDEADRDTARAAAEQQNRLNTLIAATPTGKLAAAREEMQFLAASLEKTAITEEQFLEAVGLHYGQAAESIDEMGQFAIEAARNMQDAMADGFFDIMQGKFDKLGSSFKATLDRMVANAIAANLSEAMFGNFGKTGKVGGWAEKLLNMLPGGGGGDSGALNFAGEAAAFIDPFAAGGVLRSAGLHPYANTIVSSPTLFKFAQGGAFSRGLMGESGPEAIMPLTRGPDGKLGVQASGGANITVIVQGATNAPDVRRAAGQGAREALTAFSGAQRYG